MRILVLGGYGFIGQAVVRRLQAAGHEIVGLGRDLETGRRIFPALAWIGVDLATMRSPEAWLPQLAGIDAVVNASGALQDGPRDDLDATQRDAIKALIAACERQGIRSFAQISAPGAEPGADTAFLRSKGEADRALMRSRLDWFVLRPGLVVGADAYGGTALLRMLAALPFAQVLVFGAGKVQTVALDEVAEAVRACLAGEVAARNSFDLVSTEVLTLREVVSRFRCWLGLPTPRFVVDLPARLGFAVARAADLAGWLGWRSPLRSTALTLLSRNILGDARPWRNATGRDLAGLAQTLAAIPATRQERIFARSQLALPVLVLMLALFWLLSGVIGLWQWREAAAVLPSWLPPQLAAGFVVAGAFADISIGLALLHRRWLARAAIAAIAVSLFYLAAGTLLTPHLWADPLGPFVKVLPGIGLALAVLALTGER